MTGRVKKWVFLGLICMVAGIGAAHYFTPGHLILYHDTLRRLSYFPIAIGAILYGVPGGLAMAFLSCLSFVPHLFMFWYQGPQAYYSELSEILFYLAAGLVIGMISGRENRMKQKYKALSEQLADSYQRLHDQAEKLVAAEEALGRSQRLSLLGHVSASLAHEIKNPLAGIKGAAEILGDGMDREDPKYEFLEILRREIARLNLSVEEVLAYCRGRQVRETDPPRPVDEVVGQVARVLGPGMKEKGVEFTSAGRGSSFDLPGAAATQVMMNLILNALEAVPEKGRIAVTWESSAGSCRIRVEDNGPGLDQKAQETVFHSFVTFKEGGTGLGLSITRKIVQRLGGRVFAGKSDLGGALFQVELPQGGGDDETDHSAH